MARKTSTRNGRQKHGHGQSQSSSSPPVSGASRKQKQTATGQWSWTHTFVTVGIGILLAAIAYQYLYSDKNPMIRMSVALRNHINPAVLTMEQKNRIDALTLSLNEPLADLITTKLRPVQERIASLRTQCSQYEKMEQIPGGPTQFIQSSIHEIRTDIVPKILYTNNEVNLIIRQNAEKTGAMSKTFTKLEEADDLQEADESESGLAMLERDELFLYRRGDIPAAELEMAKQESSLEHVTGLVEELADMFEKIEEAEVKLNALSGLVEFDMDKLRNTEFTKEETEAMFPYLMEIIDRNERVDEFKKINNKYFQLFEELNSERYGEMLAAFKQLYETDRHQPYLDLKMDIMKDIGNLKIRIQNLGHLYAKRQPPL